MPARPFRNALQRLWNVTRPRGHDCGPLQACCPDPPPQDPSRRSHPDRRVRRGTDCRVAPGLPDRPAAGVDPKRRRCLAAYRTSARHGRRLLPNGTSADGRSPGERPRAGRNSTSARRTGHATRSSHPPAWERPVAPEHVSGSRRGPVPSMADPDRCVLTWHRIRILAEPCRAMRNEENCPLAAWRDSRCKTPRRAIRRSCPAALNSYRCGEQHRRAVASRDWTRFARRPARSSHRSGSQQRQAIRI